MALFDKIPGRGRTGSTGSADSADSADSSMSAGSATKGNGARLPSLASSDKSGGEEPDLAERSNFLLSAVQRAARMQTTPITRYVNMLRKRHPEKNPAEIQKTIDKHYRTIVTTTGGGAGASAAVPGVGTLASLGLSTGDAFFFLEATTWYTLASALLRGIDISREDTRTSLVLLAINGSSGNEAVATLLGAHGISGLHSLATPAVGQINNRLARMAVKSLRRRLARTALAKAMPLGIGAVLGAKLNHTLAKDAQEHVIQVLGSAPIAWAESVRKELEAGDSGSSDARTALERAWDKLAQSGD